jgi:SAM-dependent methyltransferase
MTEPLPPQVRYQFKPTLGSSHWWALGCVDTLPAAGKALDIGSGSGGMGEQLRSRGAKRVVAVEIDPDARAHARGIYDDVYESLEMVPENDFDLVLLLDVVEHTTDPLGVIRAAAGRLAPGGTLLLSVPNVAHWSVRLSLLLGYFEPTQRGILDRTHFQFFTRRRVEALFGQALELRVVQMSASIPPYEFLLPKVVGESGFYHASCQVRSALADFFPGVLGYQHLVRAVRRA